MTLQELPARPNPTIIGRETMEFEAGQIWRKDGPVGWERIEEVLTPDNPYYDGGAPGIIVTSFNNQVKNQEIKKFFYALKDVDGIKRYRHLAEPSDVVVNLPPLPLYLTESDK